MTLRMPMMIAAASLSLAAAAPPAKPRAATPPVPTKPTPPPTTIGCILASNVFVQQEPDATKKALAGQTLAFFLGRLDPRTTTAQLKTSLETTANSLKGVNAAQLMNECLADFRTKALLLQAVGQQLQQQKK